LATKGKQRADAHVEAVGQREADQQDAEQQPHQMTRKMS
jgi:hypothetical protein